MVVWTPRARADIKAIHDYIAKDSPLNVKQIIKNIVRKADILLTFPQAGKKVMDINSDDVREVHVYSWRIIYQLKNETAHILTVVHKRRNIQADEL
jgi:addiction module RelE/StbE family toxin